MEKEKVFKTLVDVAKVAIPLGIVIHGSVYAFSGTTKAKIIERQEGRCAECGSTGHLQCHHRVPQCMGGNDTEANGVALCPSDHKFWDNMTLKEGIMYPGRPIQNAPFGLIKSMRIFRRTVAQVTRRR